MTWLPSRSPTLALAVACLLLLACGGRRGGRVAPGSDGGTGTDAGTPTDGGGTDGGGPDASPPVDGGPPDTDAGTDAGPPDLDAGTDAGPPDFDAGTDAGPPEVDAGPPSDRIVDIQNGTIPTGTAVTIRGVVVTGLYSVGMWVQDPSAGAMYSGIRVYTASAPTVTIGDLVDVEGDVIEYYDETEIELATVTDRGSTTPISPTPLTVAQARDEAYEGVLVRLTDVTSTVTSYDCSVDDAGCSDPDLWEARSGSNGIVVFDYVYEDADWLSHVGETPVSGIMGWRYARRRIMPRTASDFGP